MQKFGNRLTGEGILVVSSEKFRDQKRNYEYCLEKISQMVAFVLHPPKKRLKTKPSYSSKQKRLQSKKVHSKKKTLRTKNWD
jgi:ribosome-associated protein